MRDNEAGKPCPLVSPLWKRQQEGQLANPTGIKYVVVVMLENRSFDNVLGWMQSGFPGTYANPNPNNPAGPTIALQNLSSQTIGGSGASYP